MGSYKNIDGSGGMFNTNGLPNENVSQAESILNATDWTQLPDSGLTDNCVALFATYRASVRVIRKTNPANPSWPNAPTEEWS